MNPNRTYFVFLCFLVIISFLITISCNKDSSLFYDTILNNSIMGKGDSVSSIQIEDQNGINDEELDSLQTSINETVESRTTIFFPINDAYLQNGKGFNQPIVRLGENQPTSYLMFDLSPIDSVGGNITAASLQFTVDSQSGSGKITAYKGTTNEWGENDLTNNSAPDLDLELGTISKEYLIGSTEVIELSATEISPEIFTLVLNLEDGKGLAFASKENQKKISPKLIVTYSVPRNAEEIVVEEPIIVDQGEGTTPDGTTDEGETTNGGGGSSQNEAPEAVSEAAPSSGTVPLKVDFNGSKSTDDNAISSYSWDFKDGSSAKIADPSHTFTKAGSYAVELTVLDEKGLSHKTTITITVSGTENEAPKAVVSSNINSGPIPLDVQFTGNKSTDDKGVTGYAWDFKDGSTSDKANPSHTFTKAGTYAVELTVKDEKGLSDKKTITITVSEVKNEAPKAVVSTNVTSGSIPLDVQFTGDESTDDNEVTVYAWDFKDGSTSDKANPSHVFTKVGTYAVELTVKDEDGLSDKKTITITVSEVKNEAPKAVATANHLSGEAPLQVNFTGGSSSDDKGVVSYYWNFPGNASSDPNTAYTFNDPGVYDITLTVTDAEGLTDTANLTVTVNQGSTGNPEGGNIPCSVGGGLANETGEKVWCWKDVNVPGYSGNSGVPFSNKELSFASECNEQQVSKVGDRLRFNVNPTSPEPGNWCNNKYNMRAEISTLPWNVRNPLGTEEWFGWEYTFGNNYIVDVKNGFLFFQIHNGVVGMSPAVELTIAQAGRLDNSTAGTLFVENNANALNNNIYDYKNTGIVPVAGQTMKIVVHVIWGRGTDGLLQVWVDGNKVYDKRVDTVYNGSPWGGNAKWGIYKWGWREADAIQKSLDQGITHLETFMGPLRMITRHPGDLNYRKDTYSRVAPD